MRGQISLFYASKPLKELKHQLLMLHCRGRKQVVCAQQNGFSLKCDRAIITRGTVSLGPIYTNGLIALKVCSVFFKKVALATGSYMGMRINSEYNITQRA